MYADPREPDINKELRDLLTPQSGVPRPIGDAPNPITGVPKRAPAEGTRLPPLKATPDEDPLDKVGTEAFMYGR